MTTVARFEIGYSQFLASEGKPTRPLPAFARQADALLARAFDAKAIALQRTGKIGTYLASIACCRSPSLSTTGVSACAW